MQWNLKSHITDHSALTIDNLNLDFNESDSKNIHFTLSIDLCQLLINHNCRSQEDIDNLMKIQKPSKLEGFLYCIINFSMLQKFYPLF